MTASAPDPGDVDDTAEPSVVGSDEHERDGADVVRSDDPSLLDWARAVERAGWRAIERGTKRIIPDPAIGEPPAGYLLDLPGRGRTFVVDAPGPDPDAPVVVLLHALVCTAYLSWAAAFADLRDYRVIAFDQRWHGRGIRSPQFRLEDCADDVVAVLDALGIDRAVVVGYSMGGAIAQLTSHRHPERVEGLVLCSTAETFRGSTPERLFFPMLAAVARPFGSLAARQVERLGSRLPDTPSMHIGDPRTWAAVQFRSTSMWSVPEVLAVLGEFDSSAWIGEVAVPTAVVVTTHDHAVPPRQQHRLAEAVDGAQVFEAPAGHAAQALSYPTWSPAFLAAVSSVVDAAAEHGADTGAVAQDG